MRRGGPKVAAHTMCYRLVSASTSCIKHWPTACSGSMISYDALRVVLPLVMGSALLPDCLVLGTILRASSCKR